MTPNITYYAFATHKKRVQARAVLCDAELTIYLITCICPDHYYGEKQWSCEERFYNLAIPQDALRYREAFLDYRLGSPAEFNTAQKAYNEYKRQRDTFLNSTGDVRLDIVKADISDAAKNQSIQLPLTLDTPFEELNFSVRTFNCLKEAQITSLRELIQYERDEIMKFRNFGQKSLLEIEQILYENGLDFGIDFTK